MMKLLSSPPSPFGRKVSIVAAMKGLSDQIQLEKTDTSPLVNETLRKENPLAKIPVLIPSDGTQIYDSQVICEYLDSLSPQPRLFPATGLERAKTMTLASLADGVLEAALLLVYEKRYRPEDKWVESWMERQQVKVDTALDWLEQSPPEWTTAPDYAHVTLACALGYLDFRHGGHWRASRPNLVVWLDKFAAAVPAFDQTRPS